MQRAWLTILSCLRRVLPVVWFCLALVRCDNSVDVLEEDNSTTSQATSAKSDGWQVLAPGVERRDRAVQIDSGFNVEAVLVRVDPSATIFRVHYSPDTPRLLTEWHDLLPQAKVIVNAAFFDEDNRALGLLVSDDQFFGQSFAGFGGMFQVAGDEVRVRSLVSEPYRGEALTQAVQAFPMLLEVGGVLAPQGEGFDRRSRRTVIAQDRSGRIIFAVFPFGTVSLAELQQWLLASDLDLHIALALDGGRSTGMAIYTATGIEVYPSLDQLPSVIAVYAP